MKAENEKRKGEKRAREGSGLRSWTVILYRRSPDINTRARKKRN